MKLTALLPVLVFLVGLPAKAFRADCKPPLYVQLYEDKKDHSQDQWTTFTGGESNAGSHLLIYGMNDSIVCKTNKGEIFRLDFEGFGPGIETDYQMSYRITCPALKSKKLAAILDRKESYTLYGPQMDFGIWRGGKAGTLFHPQFGPCTLTAFGETYGGSLKVAKVRISKRLPDVYEQAKK